MRTNATLFCSSCFETLFAAGKSNFVLFKLLRDPFRCGHAHCLAAQLASRPFSQRTRETSGYIQNLRDPFHQEHTSDVCVGQLPRWPRHPPTDSADLGISPLCSGPSFGYVFCNFPPSGRICPYEPQDLAAQKASRPFSPRTQLHLCLVKLLRDPFRCGHAH